MAVILTYCFAVILVIAALADARDFCNLNTCWDGTHTMCRFTSPKPSKKCVNVVAASLTDEERQEILEAHNNFRAFVASGQEGGGLYRRQPGGHIPPLSWDYELEQVAQRWANQCTNRHDRCRNVARFRVGQNIGSAWASDGYSSKLSDIIQRWYNEVKFFDGGRVPRYHRNVKTGHYTQLVWGESTVIGCGVVKFEAGPPRFTTRLVCNYGPAGNLEDSSVYETH